MVHWILTFPALDLLINQVTFPTWELDIASEFFWAAATNPCRLAYGTDLLSALLTHLFNIHLNRNLDKGIQEQDTKLTC